MRLNRRQRRGSVLIEAAFVYPVLFLLVLGLIMLGILVFRYQQVAHVSREASRWASVHGGAYANDPLNTDTTQWATPGRRAATPDDVYTNAIAPFAVAMQGGLSYSVEWTTDGLGNPLKNPTRTVPVLDPASGLLQDKSFSNMVSVTVTYTWNTGLFGTIPVSSTSVNAIQY